MLVVAALAALVAAAGADADGARVADTARAADAARDANGAHAAGAAGDADAARAADTARPTDDARDGDVAHAASDAGLARGVVVAEANGDTRGADAVRGADAMPPRDRGARDVTAHSADGVDATNAAAQPVDISQGWVFRAGDDDAWRTTTYDDTAWEHVVVPRGLGEQGHRDLVGHYWLRQHLHVVPGDAQLSVRLGPVDSAYVIYVDGVSVGGNGSVDPPEEDAHDRAAIWPISARAAADGDVVIALRAWRNPLRQSAAPARGGIWSGPNIVGVTADLVRAQFAKDLDKLLAGAVILVVGLYHLQLFRRRREQKPYLWFGLFCLSMSAYLFMSTDASTALLGTFAHGRVFWTALILTLPLFAQFIWPLLGLPIRRFWRVNQIAMVAYAAIDLAWPSQWFVIKFIPVFEVVLMLPLMIGVSAVIVRAAWRGNREARTLLLGTIGLVVAAADNILLERTTIQLPQLMSYAMALLVLSMAVSLANQFSRVFKDLDDKNVALVRMDRLKDEFLANTSHELRSPIHGMIGIAESLVDGATGTLPPATVDNLKMIVRSGERLNGLVSDILDFAKLKEGQLALVTRAVDVRATVDVVLRMMAPLAFKKNLTLENAVVAALPRVRADEHRLQQILFNLVGNAIKFTDKGRVSVEASALDGEVRVDVIDSGIGIDAKDHARIFESFEQADGSTARAYGGTGIGLTVTKRLVGLHAHEGKGGVVSVESAPGKGARFSFTLPLAGAQPSAAAVVGAFDPPGGRYGDGEGARTDLVRRVGDDGGDPVTVEVVPSGGARFKVLIVDDEPVNLQVLENHLALTGYDVVRAADGPAALALVAAGLVPDLVLLDVMMPRMSGFEVCQALRRARPAAELPIVLVTAKNQVNDVIVGFDAGANDYLTKPIGKRELLARIRTHLHVAKMNASARRFVPDDFLALLGKETLLDVEKGDQVQREMSVLFSDLRAFTTLVEKKGPAASFTFVNEFYAHMEPAIVESGGFIDSFIGDAIMALFAGTGADAVAAGVGMQRRLVGFNADRVRSGEAPVHIGVGVNTGPLTIGTLGGHDHLKCGVIGDCVNLASRIEGMTKMYGARFLVSDDTRTRAGDAFTFREVDRVQAKGKAQPVTIFEVLDADDDAVHEKKAASLARFDAALATYRARKFDDAAAHFADLAKGAPDDAVLAMYAQRAADLAAAPPGADWDGVVRLTSK